MVRNKQKTTVSKINTNNWYIFDLKDKILGRSASKIVKYLIGKNKANYSYSLNDSSHVIIINAASFKITGLRKAEQSFFEYHTGYPSGKRKVSLKTMMAKYPERAVMLAVKRMLPKNKLQNDYLAKLHIYRDSNHKHEANKPKEIKL